MKLTYNNFAHRSLCETFKNYNFFENEDLIERSTLQFKFRFKLDLDRLVKQAYLFSDVVNSANSRLNYQLGIKEQELCKRKMEELYIYSFFKTFYHLCFQGNITQETNFGYCFLGHSSLLSLFTVGMSQSQDTDTNIYINYSFSYMSPEERKYLIYSMVERFPFLNQEKFFDPSASLVGTITYKVQDYEQLFLGLEKVYRSTKIISGINVVNKKGKQKNDHLENVVNEIHGSIHLGMISNYMGHDSILMYPNLPLLNGFVGEDFSDFYFINVPNGKAIKYNSSLFFARANFISLDQDQSSIELDRYYNYVNIEKRKEYLSIMSEVYAITGMKPNFSGYNGRDGKSYNIPSFRTIADKLASKGLSVDQTVINTLVNKFKNDFESYFTQLLEEIAETK